MSMPLHNCNTLNLLMNTKKIIFVILLFSSCAITSCSKDGADIPPYHPPPEVSGKTYSAYDITAFKQLTLDVTEQIIKWPGHISIYLADTGYNYLTDELDSIIREIDILLDTNLLVSRTTDSAKANLIVYLRSRDSYLSADTSVKSTLENSNYVGLTHLEWDENGNAYHGNAFVDMERTDTITQRHVIHHEMMHALGFYGHVTLPGIYTVLTYRELTPYVVDYTDFDKRMMQLLYNPAVKAGMKETEFNETVKNL